MELRQGVLEVDAGVVETPRSVASLLERAHGLSGQTVGELASHMRIRLPLEPGRAKGFLGNLIEEALGATAGNAPKADFPSLGVELKTIPLRPDGTPTESTFVTTCAVWDFEHAGWHESRVWKKLRCVLFVPVESIGKSPSTEEFAARRIGAPLLWKPSDEEEELLRSDWEHLAGTIASGGAERLSAHEGQVLQVRPKARNAQSRHTAPDGQDIHRSKPIGFYLRARFTKQVIARLVF